MGNVKGLQDIKAQYTEELNHLYYLYHIISCGSARVQPIYGDAFGWSGDKPSVQDVC